MADSFELGWLLGLIEGEGSFYVLVQKDARAHLRYYFRPVFSIQLTMRDKDGLIRVKQILNKYGIHCIRTKIEEARYGRSRTQASFRLYVAGKSDLEKLRRLLAPLEWGTEKRKDFEAFYKIIRMIPKMKKDKRGRFSPQLSKDLFLRILEIRDEMNLRGKRQSRYTKEYFKKLWGLTNASSPISK